MNQDYIDWLYGLSAPMVALNKESGASYTSPFFFPGYEYIDMQKDWGIHSRETLLAMVFNMVDDGHATALSKHYFMYPRLSALDWLNYTEKQSDYDKVLLEFVEQTYSECGAGGIRSWDYARMGYILRNGITNKFITEEEALWILYRIGLRAQYYYSSWQSYFSGWFVGYQYWESLTNKEDLERLRCDLCRSSQTWTMTKLYTDENSPYHHLPWHIEIEELEKPESLMEYAWS